MLKSHAIDVGMYPNALFLYKNYLPYIKEELVIKKLFRNKASNLLRDDFFLKTVDHIVYVY